ncbi:hypothetical protein L202_02102 [Cryptococcus amylolentus CBS 6039]|uniref:Uncharacterized protein n=2 Tax=Cryptococcus amylolentus TaxID=104669 RepID=A0A1E3HZN7_9TREE|nr:hypothetical protein L202_02102 [Cryptococcus amylolentus CBS 6039]ODN81708.1 hypothetical protein L202_02102 [Cryptococcus amylolentus CBS 6039]ODO10090.1 hypothetical protein I350_02317 [Cryptococcus amylolentus CBS 6273]
MVSASINGDAPVTHNMSTASSSSVNTPYTYYQPESSEDILRLRGGCLTYYLIQRYKRSKERKKRQAAADAEGHQQGGQLPGEKIAEQPQQTAV